MQATEHQIHALHLINIVFFYKVSRKCIRPQFFKNFFKIQGIRIMNGFLYTCKIIRYRGNILPSSDSHLLCILFDRT